MAFCTKRKAKKHANKSAAAAHSSAAKAEKALEELQKLAATAGPLVSEGAREAAAKAGDLVDQVRPGIEKSIRHQQERISDLSSSLGPRAEKLRADVEEDYLPRARRTAEATSTVVRAAVDAARKEVEKGQGDIRKAALTPTKRKKGRAGTVLLILGLTAVGAAAGYVAWKKTRPVEDPWAPPADFARAHYPASAGTESDSSTVSDTVGSADAGDVANALRGEDRTGDVTPKEVKVDSAETDANGKVIDPAVDPKDNPADPRNQEKRGTHRGDA